MTRVFYEPHNLFEEGYLSIDTHMHSSASYDTAKVNETNPQIIVKRQEELGLVKLLSDHDTMEGYNNLIQSGYSDIIPAVEIKIKPEKARFFHVGQKYHTLHFNLFGFTTEQYLDVVEILKEKDLDMLVDYLKNQKIFWQYNHPAWCEKNEFLNKHQVYLTAKHYAPVIELNAGRPKYANDLALLLSKTLGKGISGGSDGHIGLSSVGRSYVVAKGKEFGEAWERVMAGDVIIKRYDATAKSMLKDALTIIKQIYHDERLKSQSFVSLLNSLDTINFKLPNFPKSFIKNSIFFLQN